MCRLLIALIFCLTLGGCMADHTQVMADTDPKGWGGGAVVLYENQDTLSSCDVEILIRYDQRFKDKKIDLTINTMAPDSTTHREKIMLDVDRLKAKKTSANFYEIKFPYRNDVIMKQRGGYKYSISPSEGGNYVGVWAVGINFKK